MTRNAPWQALGTIALIMFALGWSVVSFRFGLLIGPGWLALMTVLALIVRSFA